MDEQCLLPDRAGPAPLPPPSDLRNGTGLDLSGKREFAFAPEERGPSKRWQRPGPPFPGRGGVPFPEESGRDPG